MIISCSNCVLGKSWAFGEIDTHRKLYNNKSWAFIGLFLIFKMRRFALFFFISSLSFAQENVLVDSICEVIGDDFYEITLDRQDGKSLASSTRKARAMVKNVWVESLAIYDQDAAMPLNELLEGWFIADEFAVKRSTMFLELYESLLTLVYERGFKSLKEEEASYLRDYIFADCKIGLTGFLKEGKNNQ